MPDNPEKAAKDFFKQKADEEGLSLRAFCRKYGIVYESFFGLDHEGDVPNKVYLSTLSRSDGEADKSPSDDS